MRIVTPRRNRPPTKRANMADLKELLRDERVSAQYGVVTVPGPSQKHWERDEDGDILVHVETIPRGLELLCRLSSAAGQISAGLWRVPAVGTEVAVLVPDGELEHMPILLSCLSSGGAPARVGEDLTLLVAPDAIEVDAPAIRLGGEHADQSEIRGDDYRGAEDTLLTNGAPSLLAAFTALAAVAVGPLSALQPGFSQAVTALTTFQTSAAAANGFKSTVVKVR